MSHHGEHPAEHVPTHEEVRGVFEQLLGGRAYSVVGEPRADSFVIETIEDGERVEYDYATAKYDHRKESLPDTAKFSASIHKTYYDGDMPLSGECVANYVNGTWTFVR